MYLHEVEEALQASKKVRRLSWPKGHFIAKEPAGPVELSPEKRSELGLSAKAPVEMGSVIIYCNGKGSATYGYALTTEDRTSQDWEEVPA